MADRIAELDGVPPPKDPDAVSTRAAVLVADLVEPARVTTLEKLDEGRRALTIATGWLRSKLEPSRAETDADSASEAPPRHDLIVSGYGLLGGLVWTGPPV